VRRSRRRESLPPCLGGGGSAALLLAAALALYGNTLGNDFVWDDRLSAAAPSLAARTGAFYRPVVMLSFKLDGSLWGGWAGGFHLTNVVAHAAVAWLLRTLALAAGMGAGVALVAALLFLAHPVQSEAVAYISGRTDILCAFWLLLALLAWRRARRGADVFALATSAALALALLSKETAVLVPLVLLLPAPRAETGDAGVGLPEVAAARPPFPLLPLLVAGTWLLVSGPGLYPRGLAGRLPAIALAAFGYLRLLLWPLDLHLERFTPVAGWSPAAIGAVGVLAVAGAGLFALARRLPGGVLFLGLAALLYAPVSGVIPVYPAVADRVLFTPEHFLYLPLLGLAPLVAAAWPRRGAPLALGIALALWAPVVIDRNRDWRDEATLFRHTLAHEPPTARVWYNLANLELAAGRLDAAARLYEAALVRDPRDGAAHLNLAITRQRQGDLPAAETHYRLAIANDPRLVEAYRGLAAVLLSRGARAEAREVLERAGGSGARPERAR
jgi:hypothetical protein